MSKVISVENLGKKYLLSHQVQRQPYVALRDVIAENCMSWGRRIASPFLGRFQSPVPGPQSPTREDFWALKDVSLEIEQGDRVGIIGRNGAGKSTLLKILSRIVEPTKGRVIIKGRVASLLEVGTGFHPELTGRENIFLNGAILGMTRAEIKKKFDEIVDFAEIEKFLDTPVKRYSSGMYVRLAFAVAAHLEPEILLVDEVLAVGDAQFQKKCLGKMEDVSRKEGRTVLFVSHNMGAVSSLCNRGMVFEKGAIFASGCMGDCIQLYYNQMEKNQNQRREYVYTISNSSLTIEDIGLLGKDDEPVRTITLNDDIKLFIKYNSKYILKNISIHFGIYNILNTGVLRFESLSFNKLPPAAEIECRCDKVALSPGQYKLNVCLLSGSEVICYMPEAFFFTVIESDYFGTGKLPDLNLCQVLVNHKWIIKELNS